LTKNNEETITLLESLFENISLKEKIYYQKKGDIAVQLLTYIKEKGLNQKAFAKILGMKESRLSKILSGAENLTLKTITQLESVLEKDLIIIPKFSIPKIQKQIHVVAVPINAYTNFTGAEKNNEIIEYSDDKQIFSRPIISKKNNEINFN
jgi:transcriptional regulator with XRE-family HTH domain